MVGSAGVLLADVLEYAMRNDQRDGDGEGEGVGKGYSRLRAAADLGLQHVQVPTFTC